MIVERHTFQWSSRSLYSQCISCLGWNILYNSRASIAIRHNIDQKKYANIIWLLLAFRVLPWLEKKIDKY